MPGCGTFGDSTQLHTLESFGFIDQNGYLSKEGSRLLGYLLMHVEPGNWGEAFIPLKKMGVHCAVELVILDGRGVFLTWRDDAFFTGWHTPGTYLWQGETWEVAAKRCAKRELGVDVSIIRPLCPPMNNTDNPRFHDVTVLLLCCITQGIPVEWRWFVACPEDMIPSQQKYWPAIAPLLILPSFS